MVHANLGGLQQEWRCIFGPPGEARAIGPDLAVALGDRWPRGDRRRTPYLRFAPDADSRPRRRTETLAGGELPPGFSLPLAELCAQVQAWAEPPLTSLLSAECRPRAGGLRPFTSAGSQLELAGELGAGFAAYQPIGEGAEGLAPVLAPQQDQLLHRRHQRIGGHGRQRDAALTDSGEAQI